MSSIALQLDALSTNRGTRIPVLQRPGTFSDSDVDLFYASPYVFLHGLCIDCFKDKRKFTENERKRF